MKKEICALMAILLLVPMTAFAVKEGVVEEAAPVDLAELESGTTRSYLPDESYYAFSGDIQPTWAMNESYTPQPLDSDSYNDTTQNPYLTPGEIARAKVLAEAYQKGEKTGDGKSILGKIDQVELGVYPLDPEAFDGEKVFVLLPGTCLTDEQILSFLDAYHLLGLSFNPEGLNFRNCARGGGIETTRFLTDEERERRNILAEQIRFGILKTDGLDTSMACSPKLNPVFYNGMMDFTFRPYRSMTDEELLAELVVSGVHDETAEMDFADLEMRARQLGQECFGLPMSMKLDSISKGSYVPFQIAENGEVEYAWNESVGREGHVVLFTYQQNGMEYLADAWFDAQTGKPVSIRWCENHYDDPFDDAKKETRADSAVFLETAEQYAKKIHQNEPLQWHSGGDVSLQCVLTERYTAALPDQRSLNLHISLDGQHVLGAEIKWEALPEK